MSNNEFNQQYSFNPDYQELPDGTLIKRSDDGIYRPVVNHQPLLEQNYQSGYLPQESLKKEKRKHPPMTKPTKFVIGSLVAGMCVLPITGHVITEYQTNAAMDAVKPGGDEPLTPEDLIHDLSKTVDGFTLKPIRNMLGGE